METLLLLGALAIGANALMSEDVDPNMPDPQTYTSIQTNLNGGYLHNTKIQESEVKWVFVYE